METKAKQRRAVGVDSSGIRRDLASHYGGAAGTVPPCGGCPLDSRKCGLTSHYGAVDTVPPCGGSPLDSTTRPHHLPPPPAVLDGYRQYYQLPLIVAAGLSSYPAIVCSGRDGQWPGMKTRWAGAMNQTSHPLPASLQVFDMAKQASRGRQAMVGPPVATAQRARSATCQGGVGPAPRQSPPSSNRGDSQKLVQPEPGRRAAYCGKTSRWRQGKMRRRGAAYRIPAERRSDPVRGTETTNEAEPSIRQLRHSTMDGAAGAERELSSAPNGARYVHQSGRINWAGSVSQLASHRQNDSHHSRRLETRDGGHQLGAEESAVAAGDGGRDTSGRPTDGASATTRRRTTADDIVMWRRTLGAGDASIGDAL